MAAHARDVNILIWTSRKSVDHGTNDRVMVHGDGTRADGRRSSYYAHLSQIVGSRGGRAAVEITVNKSYVVGAQAGYLARPITEAPETQIYFINHRSGAFLVLRLRTVVRGERASRSIVNRTTALWSIWMVASLILAGLGSEPFLDKPGVAKSSNREALTGPNHAHGVLRRLDGLYHQQTEGNEHKLGSCLVEFFSRPPSAGRRLRFRRLCMKTGLELI